MDTTNNITQLTEFESAIFSLGRHLPTNEDTLERIYRKHYSRNNGPVIDHAIMYADLSQNILFVLKKVDPKTDYLSKLIFHELNKPSFKLFVALSLPAIHVLNKALFLYLVDEMRNIPTRSDARELKVAYKPLIITELA